LSFEHDRSPVRPEKADIVVTVNGEEKRSSADPATPLLYVLRNDFRLNGPKYGCGLGECGACLVLVDGKAARSCTLPVSAMAGRTVTTLEGLGTADSPHPIQQAFIEEQGAQCGYCLNGMIMRTAALLAVNPAPNDAEIRAALRFNLCRCGTHVEILASVRRATQLMAGHA
jgi:nicotinate dehydrogenase subunit A